MIKTKSKDPIFYADKPFKCTTCEGKCLTDKTLRCLDCNNKGVSPIGWYFYDETWSNAYGPYRDRPAAQEHLIVYAKVLEGKEEEI